MDLSELADLAGQTLTTEQLTEATAVIKTTLPKLHTAIRQDGFRAGLSTTKEDYEKADKTGLLDKALAAVEAHLATIVERDEQVARLSEEKPDVAKIVAEKDLTIKGLQDKYKTLQEDGKVKATEYVETLATKERQIFDVDLERHFQGLHLKPREVRFAVSETKARARRDNGEWKVYEEDGKTPILVDDTSTPVKALAESYVTSLPKEAFKDQRSHGPVFEDKGTNGGSRTIRRSDFDKLSAADQHAVGVKASKGETKIVD